MLKQLSFRPYAVAIVATLLIIAFGAPALLASKSAPGTAQAQVTEPSGGAGTICADVGGGGSTELSSLPENQARPCKPCKDKPYCGCTYNGQPRASCDPCCYFDYWRGYICLD